MDGASQNIRILKSKILPPRFSDTIKRARFFPLFSKIGEKRVTSVVAGAGYGKTTLVAQGCEILGLDTVWYRLDSSDRDFITFIHYLVAGLRKHYHEIGKETLGRIEAARILSREQDAVLTILLSELEEQVDRHLVIVLDDYHLVQESTEINRALNFLIERFPEAVHLVIVSRIDPHIFLSLYRARREVIDITEKDLAFTKPEIQDLYRRSFDIEMPEHSLETLHKKTHGWVSGLILFYHLCRGRSLAEIEALLQELKGSHKIIFSYLEENIYDRLPDDIRNFLAKTSILSRLNIDFCNRFLGIENSGDLLKYLEDKHLFTFPFDEDRQWYHYHHLFQDFLQKKLSLEHGSEATRRLNFSAAELWEEIGEGEEALSHYLKAGQIDRACERLSAMGRKKMLKENRLQLINSYLNEIPPDYSETNPWIQLIRARVLQFSGKYQQAIFAFEKAYDAFAAEGSPKGIGRCLKGLAYNYFLIGYFSRAEKIFSRLLEQVESTPLFNLDILGYMIFVTSHLGKMQQADQHYRKARSIPESGQKDFQLWLSFNMGFRYGCSGDFALALKAGEEILHSAGDLEDYPIHAMAFHLAAWSCYYLGFFSKGKQYAEEGIALIEGKGFYDGAQAWLLMSLALNETALELFSEAIEDGKKSLKIFTDLEIRWGQAYAGHALQYAFQKSGNLQEAEEYARNALEIVRGLELPLEEGYIKCGLADLLLEKGQTEEAGPLLEDSEKKLETSKLNLCRACLQYARFYWNQEQMKAALEKLVAALTISRENNYGTWVVYEKQWIIPLLVEAFAQNKMADYAVHICKTIGMPAVAALKKTNQIKGAVSVLLDDAEKMPPPLRVYCLGKFRLFRGEEEIPADWSSEKAKMLFKYLVLKRETGFQHKDILMELLWPDEDPALTANRLRVALTALRKTLEPELAKRKPSAYLERNGEAYTLSFGKNGWSDIDIFKKTLQQAKTEKKAEVACALYEKAVSLYTGDLFAEDPYCQWCFDSREELRETHLDALSALITHHTEKGNDRKAIEYALAYLNFEKYNEGVYQHLMRLYSKTGNRAMAIKTYQQCKRALKEGLSCAPDMETQALYHSLKSAS